MSRSVTYKLRGQALDAALKFSADLNMDLNTAAERALLWAIRQAYSPSDSRMDGTDGAIRQAYTESPGETLQADSARDPDEALGVPGGGAALADSGSVAAEGLV